MIFFVLHFLTNYRTSPKSLSLILMKILIFIMLIFILILFLFHYTGQNYAQCGTCEQPIICQLICRRQCKLCAFVDDDKLVDSGVNNFVQNRKLYHRPIVRSDEEPFYTDGNPFATGNLQSHETQLPMPEKRELVTQLTISESELEEELKQHFDPDRNDGLQRFVTAPSTFEDKVGTVIPRKLSPGVDDITLTLTMSRELMSEDNHMHQTVISPPAFNPQPPGFTPMPSNSTITQGRITTRIVSERYPSNSLESIENNFENIDDEKEECDAGNCNNGQRKTISPKTEMVSTKGMKITSVATTKIQQQRTLFLKGLFRTTQRVPGYKSWSLQPGKTQTRTTQRTTLKAGCDSPPICGRNCGIIVDSNGCQSCDCLWKSKNCRSDMECRSLDGQICDLGRCECGPGYEHHQKSGICQRSKKVIRHARQRGVLVLTSPVPPTFPILDIQSSSLISGRSHHSIPQQRQFIYQPADFFDRIKRSNKEPRYGGTSITDR